MNLTKWGKFSVSLKISNDFPGKRSQEVAFLRLSLVRARNTTSFVYSNISPLIGLITTFRPSSLKSLRYFSHTFAFIVSLSIVTILLSSGRVMDRFGQYVNILVQVGVESYSSKKLFPVSCCI